MKRFIVVFLCFVVLLPLMASGEVKKCEIREPVTELVIMSRYPLKELRGSVEDIRREKEVIPSFMTLYGVVAYQGGLERRRLHGLEIRIMEKRGIDEANPSNTSFLDLEEMESLSKALRYMIDLSKDLRGKDLGRGKGNVSFSIRDDFEIGFSQEGTKQVFFASNGTTIRTQCVFRCVKDLITIKRSVERGLRLLREK